MNSVKQLTGKEMPKEIRDSIGQGDRIFLGVDAVRTILQRFIHGELDADSISVLAEELEFEAVEYQTEHREQIAEVLFQLATPEINGIVSIYRCEQLLEFLKKT